MDRPISVYQRRDINVTHSQSLDSDAGQNNINNRVESADFVKVDTVDRNGVNLGFGFRDPVKDREASSLHKFGKAALLNQIPDF